ncbi:MAG: hypothetical protein KAR32_14750 [Candidatus Omnitrophica bacterium]|nr:hypothetical protein [Candidatus Omnitrophota bacterium]
MNPKILHVILFNLAYLLPAIFSSVLRANYEFILYIGVVIIAVLLVMRFFVHYGLSIALLWFLSIWGFLHMAGGLVSVPLSWPTGGETKVLYNLWIIEKMFKFDQFVHAFGFGTTTWLVWQILQRTLSRKFDRALTDICPTGGLLFLCVIGSMGLGAVNEIVEFLAMVFVPETNVGGYVNTALDLVANLTGSLIAAFLIYFLQKRKDQVPLED